MWSSSLPQFQCFEANQGSESNQWGGGRDVSSCGDGEDISDTVLFRFVVLSYSCRLWFISFRSVVVRSEDINKEGETDGEE